MLATEERRIRWMGIDMRARWRRRVAVALTYMAYFIASVWVGDWQGYGWLTQVKAMFALVLAIEFLSIFREGLLLKSFEGGPRPMKDRTGGKTLTKIGLWVGKRSVRSRLLSSWKFQLMNSERQQEEIKLAEQRVEQSYPFVAREDDSPEAPDERERVERTMRHKGWCAF